MFDPVFSEILKKTPKNVAETASHEAATCLIKQIIEQDNYDITDEYGRTILHYVAKTVNIGCFDSQDQLDRFNNQLKQMLLKMSEVAMNVTDYDGYTAQQLASIYSYPETVYAMSEIEIPTYMTKSFNDSLNRVSVQCPPRPRSNFEYLNISNNHYGEFQKPVAFQIDGDLFLLEGLTGENCDMGN